MNEAYQNLLNRFSTKKYTDQPVSDEILDAILEAGLYAPTGKNNQKAIMVAVRDKATRDQLSRMNAEIMGAQLDPFYGAPCVVVVLSDPTRNTWVEDGSLVMGNLMNAATALGLEAAGSTGQEKCSILRRVRSCWKSGAFPPPCGVSATVSSAILPENR